VFIAVVSAVDPLAQWAVSWVNQGRNGICFSGVELPIQRWVNITAQRYRSAKQAELRYRALLTEIGAKRLFYSRRVRPDRPDPWPEQGFGLFVRC
jgi:hypothetical protein